MERRDDNIIKLLFDRSETALEMIQNVYGRLIKSIAFNLFKSDSVAEECLNDTLLAIWNTIPPEKPDSLSAYAGAIARRKAIDRFRGEMTQKRHIPESSEYSEIYEELAFADDFSGDVVDKMELQRIMNEFLGSLSPGNREIFMSRFFDFESLDSIAAKMHISKNVLNARLFRMKEKLGEMLRKEGVSS